MSLQTDRLAERKARILDAARRLIAARGYEGVTMRELAQASRVSVPTLYNLFGGKRELLFEAVESRFSGLLDGLDRSASGTDRLLEIFEMCSREIVALPRYSLSLLTVFSSSQDTRGLDATMTRELATELSDALTVMQRDGDLAEWADARTLSQRLASHCIATSIEWATGALANTAVGAATTYGGCMMVLGVAQGRAHALLADRARSLQGQAGTRERVAAEGAADRVATR